MISFLCGRLVNPDWDDYKKLTKLIQYLCETIFMPWFSATMGLGVSGGGLRHHLLFTPTCVGIQVQPCQGHLLDYQWVLEAENGIKKLN